ncbi:unnamed protein product [Chrysoparadoxa australica]
MGSSSTATLNQLLEKTSDFDKDERYMATTDLNTELQKDLKLDAAMERRICTAVLKQLDDKSNDVQASVKCLGTLIKKVQEAQLGEICDKLCSLILQGKAELRDIYSIGLKTLISDVPDEMGRAVSMKLSAKLLGGIQQEKAQDTKLECLDNLTDLLRRFGRAVEADHEHIMTAVLAQLNNVKAVVRKRATACLGALAVVLSDQLLNTATEHLLEQIEHSKKPELVRTHIQAIGAISRTVGYRLGRHLDSVVPQFLAFCSDAEADDESQHTEAANELREICFQGFESFVARCPREVTPHLDDITVAALKFIKYDPNYSYGDSDGENDEEMNDFDDEDFSDDDFGGGSDDDDISWKARRSAVKLLSAIITHRPEMLESLYETCADEIIGRFKEREENVRIDVIACFGELLHVRLTSELLALVTLTGGARKGDTSKALGHPMSPAKEGSSRNEAAAKLLAVKLPGVIKASEKQLRGKSIKTAATIFQMLRTLCHVLPGSLQPYIPSLLDHVHKYVQDKNQGLKLEALLFLRLAMETHEPTTFHPQMPKTLGLVTAAVQEEWYKIIAEALRVESCIIKIMRPRDPSTGKFSGNFDYRPFVKPLYEAAMPRLSATDIDQEIKECAIDAMGNLVTIMGDDLGNELPTVLSLLMDRLKNEITRMPTLRVMALLSTSPLDLDLSSILPGATNELALFLRQQSRPLKQTTLETLVALVPSIVRLRDTQLLELVLKEAAPLISDADLHLAHLALHLTCKILAATPGCCKMVQNDTLPKAMALSVSPVLHGLALKSLLDLLPLLLLTRHSSYSTPSGLGFAELMEMCKSTTEGMQQPKIAIANVAKCMAALCVASNDANRTATLTQLVADMKSKTVPDTKKHLAMLVVGELGRQRDLGKMKGLKKILLDGFDSGDEETKTAAAYALGHVAVGSMETFLPVILESMNDSKHQYLLLSALKEVITCHAACTGRDFASYSSQILPQLLCSSHCESSEEGVRNMVAECLGTLCTMQPTEIVPALRNLGTEGDNAWSKWTAATALRYCMAARAPVEQLRPHMAAFVTMLENEDLDVRKAGLIMVNATIHHQLSLISDLLPEVIIPNLYATIELKMERVVDLGPFKHKVDDGEPLRKAALSCLDTILETSSPLLDATLLPHLAHALGDAKPDVQMQSHQLLAKICESNAGAVLSSLEILIPPLSKTVQKQVKDTQVGTEVERANDLIRSALRCVVAVGKIDEVAASRHYQELMDQIKRKDKLAAMLTAVSAERTIDLQ